MVVTFTNHNDGRKPDLRLAYISVSNRDSVDIGKTAELLGDVETKLEIMCADSEDVDQNEEEFIKLTAFARNCDLIFMKFHGDPGFFLKYDRIKKIIDSRDIDTFFDSALEEINEENRHLFKHPDKDRLLLRLYLDMGGMENYSSMLRWACRNVAGNENVAVPDPVITRLQGLYRIGAAEDIDIEEYTKDFDPTRPTIGVMMHCASFSRERSGPVDDLVAKLGEIGCNVITVFFSSYPNDLTGSIGVRRTIEKYFKKDGKAVVDAVVINTGFSQISLSDPNASNEGRATNNFFEALNVPVIQAPALSNSSESWMENEVGMTVSDLNTDVIWPEFDGQIISVPLSFSESLGDGRYRNTSVPDRVDKIAILAKEWAELSIKDPKDRRIAILFHMYPPTNDHLGGASGLDTFESVCNCMHAMEKEGYSMERVPDNGKEILDELLAGLTTDLEWVPENEIEGRAADMLDPAEYLKWYSELTDKAKDGIVRGWGRPPGDMMVHKGRIIIPGVMNGNIFVGMQPNRGQHDQAEKLYHDPFVVMPHAYLAYYRWLEHVFKADCIVHVGTHGTIEWLPGKGNALSSSCYPDINIDTVPNVYPYIVDDPGEGVQCKRRTNSVLIGYMSPAMTRAGGYDDIALLDGKLQEYFNSETTSQSEKMDYLVDEIVCIVKRMDICREVGLEEDFGKEEVKQQSGIIYDYISDLKDAMIKDGLHILGKVPEGELLTEMVYSLCRLRNGSVPSLRISIAEAWGVDMDSILDAPSEKGKDGKLNGTWISEIDAEFYELLKEMQGTGYELERSLIIAEERIGSMTDDLRESVSYVCTDIYPHICQLTNELTNFMQGIGGRYVPPGPSGSPTRGNAHLLPTGTNFYSIDPDAVPTEASWKIGRQAAEDMVKKFVDANGKYPESIGIVVWATDTMKTNGDDVAYILALMGVRPVYGSIGGKVVGLEVMPHEELGRPRIDVMSRISGLFRDSFPGLVDMLHKATEMISELDESEEINYLKKHLKEDIAKYIGEGMSPADARDVSMIRLFGDPPSQHGTGVEVIIQSSKWDNLEQIADTFTTWGCHAYGGKWKGEKFPEIFKHRTAALEVTVKNHSDRENDVLDTDDDYSHIGGLNAAVRQYRGEKPFCIMGDSSDADRLKTRTLEEETAYVMRSRVLNPKWLEGLQRHGFKGAMELSELTEYILGWGATSDSIEQWMYDAVTEKFILDEKVREWIRENNPYALKEMIEDMLECNDRDLWNAPPEMLEQLRKLYLESEGDLEDTGYMRR